MSARQARNGLYTLGSVYCLQDLASVVSNTCMSVCTSLKNLRESGLRPSHSSDCSAASNSALAAR